MNEYIWREALYRRAALDPWAEKCRKRIEELTPGYRAILETLTPQQQEELQDYIAACEEYEHSLTLLAYELGRSSTGD